VPPPEPLRSGAVQPVHTVPRPSARPGSVRTAGASVSRRGAVQAVREREIHRPVSSVPPAHQATSGAPVRQQPSSSSTPPPTPSLTIPGVSLPAADVSLPATDVVAPPVTIPTVELPAPLAESAPGLPVPQPDLPRLP